MIPPHLHRIWYFSRCGILRVRSCEHCAQQFQYRMSQQIKGIPDIEPMLLESLRIREFSKLYKEGGHG